MWCAKKDGASDDIECGAPKPQSQKACELRCPAVAIATLPPDLPIGTLNLQEYWLLLKFENTNIFFFEW